VNAVETSRLADALEKVLLLRARIAELEAELDDIHALVALQRERTQRAEAELAALKAENERLRKRLDDCLRGHYGLEPAS
jgi:regulator of replication initiation timing